MYTLFKKITRTLLALAVAVGGLVLTGSPAVAANITFNLCAVPGTTTFPGSAAVPIWGFALNTGGTCGAATLPGPILEVNQGDVVTINLTSSLPAGHTASFEVPGLAVTNPAAGQYTFTASSPGTFVYQSPGDAGRQMAMGLYGALIVRPVGEALGFVSGPCSTAAGSAYGNAFDRECVLVLSQVDTAFNAAPDTFNMHSYRATYWLVNGQAYPSTPTIAAPVGTRLLLRYVNAGHDNTAMMLLGMHERVLARDAQLLNGALLSNSFSANTEALPAGGTEDAIATIPATAPPSANGFPLFNRNLHVTNGSACVSVNPCVPNSAYTPGGMLIFIHP